MEENKGDGGLAGDSTLGKGGSILSVANSTSASAASVPSTQTQPQSWQHFHEANEIKIQAGYAEYYILNKTNDEKIFTGLLTYDERSCWYSWLCCCKPDVGYIPHKVLYPNPPEVKYERHPLNICGFGVQVYDVDSDEVMRFHREPHNTKDLTIDETMLISGPQRGLMGSITIPRLKGGDVYEIYDSNGALAFEIPPRIVDDLKQHIYDVMKVHSATPPTHCAKIKIEGKHEIQISITDQERVPAGDFLIHYNSELHPREKALILAAAFFIRIREFSSYIPMVEAMIAARAIVTSQEKI